MGPLLDSFRGFCIRLYPIFRDPDALTEEKLPRMLGVRERERRLLVGGPKNRTDAALTDVVVCERAGMVRISMLLNLLVESLPGILWVP